MPLTYNTGSGQYRFHFERLIPGRGRVRRSLTLPPGLTHDQAQQRELEETARIYAELADAVPQDPGIAEVVAAYLADRKDSAARKRAAAHLKAIAWAFEGLRLSELADAAIAVMRDGQARGLAPATVRARLSMLKAAARHAWLVCRVTPTDPTRGMSLPRLRY